MATQHWQFSTAASDTQRRSLHLHWHLCTGVARLQPKYGQSLNIPHTTCCRFASHQSSETKLHRGNVTLVWQPGGTSSIREVHSYDYIRYEELCCLHCSTARLGTRCLAVCLLHVKHCSVAWHGISCTKNYTCMALQTTWTLAMCH